MVVPTDARLTASAFVATRNGCVAAEMDGVAETVRHLRRPTATMTSTMTMVCYVLFSVFVIGTEQGWLKSVILGGSSCKEFGPFWSRI